MPSYEEYGFPGRPRRHRDRPAPWSVVIVLLVLVLLSGLGLAYFWFRDDERKPHDPDAEQRAIAPKVDPNAVELERIRVFKEVSPGVVNVDTLRIRQAGYLGTAERQIGTGSGFVWDARGRIVTNFHVIKDTLQITSQGEVSIRRSATVRVTLADHSAWNARL